MEPILSDFKFLQFSFNRDKIPLQLPATRIPYVDLTIVLDGELRYSCNGEETALKAGDAILFPMGAERQRFPSSSRASYASFNVRMPGGAELPVCGRIAGVLQSDIMLLLEMANADINRVTPYNAEKCLSVFLYLLHLVIEKATNTENPHIKRIKQYVHDHLSEPLTLSAVAESVHLVPRYVCTIFKKSTEMTLTEYICRERISLAKKLIVTSQLGLSEICGLCGFTDYNYFSRTFKRIAGVTAASYKKKKFKEVSEGG